MAVNPTQSSEIMKLVNPGRVEWVYEDGKKVLFVITDRGLVDRPRMDSEGRIWYDDPYKIPQYLKNRVRRLLESEQKTSISLKTPQTYRELQEYIKYNTDRLGYDDVNQTIGIALGDGKITQEQFDKLLKYLDRIGKESEESQVNIKASYDRLLHRIYGIPRGVSQGTIRTDEIQDSMSEMYKVIGRYHNAGMIDSLQYSELMSRVDEVPELVNKMLEAKNRREEEKRNVTALDDFIDTSSYYDQDIKFKNKILELIRSGKKSDIMDAWAIIDKYGGTILSEKLVHRAKMALEEAEGKPLLNPTYKIIVPLVALILIKVISSFR